MQAEILGARGSLPVSGAAFARFGGATSCVAVRTDGGSQLLLDAGSGILNWRGADEAAVLLGHMHLDHVLGLLMLAALQSPDFRCTLCAPVYENMAPREQLAQLMRPPIWPVTVDALRCQMDWRSLRGGEVFLWQGVEIAAFAVAHPNGCLAYRLRADGASLVYATDMEQAATDMDGLCAFASGCDLLITDAQFTAAEAADRRGWGHSSMAEAAQLGLRAGAKRTLLTHHAPTRSDEALLALADGVRAINPTAEFARPGMTITL